MSADIMERLEEESVRLSGHSIDRGSADAGIAANVASEAAETIAALRASLAEAKQELAEYDSANRDLVRRSDHWKAEAERLTIERDRYASDAGERAAKLDAALADVERLTKERDRWHVMAVQQVDFKIAANDRAEAAEAALAKAQQERDEALSALHFLCDGDVSYHDAEIRIPCGTHGEAIRRMRIARAALAPDGKTEAELRHDCAASGRHDHDGCDCSAEELARRAALAPEGK